MPAFKFRIYKQISRINPLASFDNAKSGSKIVLPSRLKAIPIIKALKSQDLKAFCLNSFSLVYLTNAR
jgi:hypothetical protein